MHSSCLFVGIVARECHPFLYRTFLSFFLFPKDQECVPLSFYNIARMAKIDALIVNVRYCDPAVVGGNFFELQV